LATGNVARLDYREKARELFDRYLHLGPLNGRARGLVRCRFHEDRTGSLSLDVAKGVFNCFGCGAQGGVRRFRELVGESGSPTKPSRRRWESDWTRAWREIVHRVRREYARRGEWLPWLVANGTVRVMTKAVDRARQTATALGPEHPRTWRILEAAAQVERRAFDAEAQLDGLLEEGRLGE
jgi:hypothetical protein